MPELPLRGWILLGALVAFAVVVLSVLYWAQFTGRAGSQRGLVIHNDLAIDLQVEFEGQPRVVLPPRGEHVYRVKRNEFPAYITWGPAGGDNLSQRDFEYREIADAEFRLSIDEQGIHPTTAYRDTPVPPTATPEVSIVIRNDLDRVPVHVAVEQIGADIRSGEDAVFGVNRADFPIYIYVVQRERDPESFFRIVAGAEFEYDELAGSDFRVTIVEHGVSARLVPAGTP